MNVRPQRAHYILFHALLVACVLGVTGCASTPVSTCRGIAGSGWDVSSHPPANAAQLLALQGVAGAGNLVWLHKGDDKVMACRYKAGLIYPGCSGSRGYVFERNTGGWKSDGVVISTCDVNG